MSAGTRTPSKRTALNRRVRSTDSSGVTVTPGVPAGTRTWVRPCADRPETRKCDARSADSTGRLMPSTTTSPPADRTSRPTVCGAGSRALLLQAPGREPGAGGDVRQDVLAGVVAGIAQRSRDEVGRRQWPGCGVRAELVGDEGQVGQPGFADRAAAVGLVDEQRGPPELRPALPVALVVPRGIVPQRAQRGDRDLVGEELGRRLTEELLIGAELPQHAVVQLPTRCCRARTTPARPAVRLRPHLDGVQYRACPLDCWQASRTRAGS